MPLTAKVEVYISNILSDLLPRLADSVPESHTLACAICCKVIIRDGSFLVKGKMMQIFTRSAG